MKRNLADYIVAIVVVLCSAALLAALTVALRGRPIREGDRVLYVDFPDVAGIRQYSEVRYGGALAGEVRAMRHLTPEERSHAADPSGTVRVTVVLDDSLPPLPADVTAGLGSDTLLSEKFVSLGGGTPGGKTLADQAILTGTPGLNIDRLAASAEVLLGHADTLIEQLDPVLDDAGSLLGDIRGKLDVTVPKLDSFIESAKDVTSSAGELLGHADSFLGDNEKAVHDNLDALRGAIANLDTLLGKTGSFVGSTDAQVEQRMEELAVILQNLKVVTTQAKAITETLGERPSRLIWPSKRRQLPSEEQILKSDRPVQVPPLR